jgi:hypothetical protein
MNFKKLSKEKRNHLILVVIITLGVLSGLGFGLIKYQYVNLKHLSGKLAATDTKLKQMREAVKNSDKLETDLVDARKTLEATESDMASGDLYAWVINTLRTFKAGYKVDMPQFSPISPAANVTLFASFPYKEATLTVAGTAHFHDLGKFIADFENQYPHIRVLNLTLDASGGGGTESQEALSFKMEIATLVKPNAS